MSGREEKGRLHVIVLGFLKNQFYGGMGCPRGSDSKESACNARDPVLIPGSGQSPGERIQIIF